MSTRRDCTCAQVVNLVMTWASKHTFIEGANTFKKLASNIIAIGESMRAIEYDTCYIAASGLDKSVAKLLNDHIDYSLICNTVVRNVQ